MRRQGPHQVTSQYVEMTGTTALFTQHMGSCEVQVESQIYIPSLSIDDGREERPPTEELDDAEGLLGG